MESRFISKFLRNPESGRAEAFGRDIANIVALSKEDRTACLNELSNAYFAPGNEEEERLLERLAADSQADREQLRNSLRLMAFFLTVFLSKDFPESDWELWASDLQELGHLNESTRVVFEEMLAGIRSELVTEIEPESRRRQATAGVLPTFAGCGATVEVRSVKTDFYRHGTPIEQFEPEIVDTTTVASISITLDEGPFKDVYFQVDEDDVEYLVNMFQSVKKEMVAFRRFLKLED